MDALADAVDDTATPWCIGLPFFLAATLVAEDALLVVADEADAAAVAVEPVRGSLAAGGFASDDALAVEKLSSLPCFFPAFLVTCF